MGALLGAVAAIAVAAAPAAAAGTAPPPVGTTAVKDGPYATGAPVSRTATTGGSAAVADGFTCAACEVRYEPLQLPEPAPLPELYATVSKRSIVLSGLNFSTESHARVQLDIWTYAGRRHMFHGQVDNDYRVMMKNGSFRFFTDVTTCYGDPDAYAVARDDVTGYTADPVPVRVGPC